MSSTPHTGAASPPRLSADEYDQLRALVKRYAGLELAPDKQREVEAKIKPCWPGSESGAELLVGLRRDTDRLHDLAERLTVGESYFHRNRPHFEALRTQVLPALALDAQKKRSLTIWSSACATGEEPYSLAVLLDQHFPALADWDVRIWGTDLSRRFLDQARQASYPAWSLRGLDPSLKSRYFAQTGPDAFQLCPVLQRRVSLEQHNLLSNADPPGRPTGGFDLVICRNVLIYFDRQQSNAVIERLIDTLRPGGFLFVGHVDSYPALGALEPCYECGTFYYRKPRSPAPRQVTAGHLIPGLAVAQWAMATKPVDTPATIHTSQSSGAPVWDRRSTENPPEAGSEVQVEFDEIRDLANTGHVADALTEIGLLAKGAGRLDHRVHFLRALVADQAGLPSESRQALRQALFLKRDFVVAHYFLGVLADRDQDWTTALRSFRNAKNLLTTCPADEPLEETGGLTAGRLREIADKRLQCIRAEKVVR